MIIKGGLWDLQQQSAAEFPLSLTAVEESVSETFILQSEKIRYSEIWLWRFFSSRMKQLLIKNSSCIVVVWLCVQSEIVYILSEYELKTNKQKL